MPRALVRAPERKTPLWWLQPAGLAFGSLSWLRMRLYDLGVLRAIRVGRPVVSVGNLTVGGNGKTPFVLWLSQELTRRQHRVVILSRGYGARLPRDPLLVSPTTGVEQAGDEPTLLARRTTASVVVHPDRVAAAEWARDRLDPAVFLLDDGFSHRRLHRDLDIVLLDAEHPFGNRAFLPAGPLREPIRALSRAQVLVATDGTTSPLLSRAVDARMRWVPESVSGERPETLQGVCVGLYCAIARPERFVATVERLGAKVVATRFLPDHAPPEDLAEFVVTARKLGATQVIISEKDATKVASLPEGVVVLTGALEVQGGHIVERVEALIRGAQ